MGNCNCNGTNDEIELQTERNLIKLKKVKLDESFEKNLDFKAQEKVKIDDSSQKKNQNGKKFDSFKTADSKDFNLIRN